MLRSARIRAEAAEAAAAAAANQAGVEETPGAEEAFTPDGELLPDGGMRYKVLCDGGIDPRGVFWARVVPAGAGADVYLEAQAERDDAIKRLAELTGK